MPDKAAHARNTTSSGVDVISRVLGLRHVLDQVHRIAQRPERGRPIGLSEIGRLRDAFHGGHRRSTSVAKRERAPHGLACIGDLEMILPDARGAQHRGVGLKRPVRGSRPDVHADEGQPAIVPGIEEVAEDPIEDTIGLVPYRRGRLQSVVVLTNRPAHEPARDRKLVGNGEFSNGFPRQLFNHFSFD
ncbi:MAG: hypothetical protein IPP91_12625 [Betaproteobacteria bacterium]|nr:hypothetical protein [Betaproteobacteria bacterium]